MTWKYDYDPAASHTCMCQIVVNLITINPDFNLKDIHKEVYIAICMHQFHIHFAIG